MSEPRHDPTYCEGEVRAHDRDRYLVTQFAPAPRRAALYALYAFNLEVAKTAEVVSEELLGQIRLEWWREAIEECYDGEPRRHEVVEALAGAIREHGLTRGQFKRLIETGALGRIVALEGRCAAGRLQRYLDGHAAWMLDPAQSGGGPMLNLGVHWIDLFRWMLGEEVEGVSGTNVKVNSE